MIAGEQHEATWDEVMWVRSALWIGTVLLAANTLIYAANSRLQFAAVDAVLAVGAAMAASLMTKRDDRGWWLAIAVLSLGVALSVVMAIANWAIGDLAGSWLALYMLWVLRQPPRFPWRLRASASA